MRFLFLPAAISLALITGCASTTAPNQPSASAPAAVPAPPTPPVVPAPDATPATAGTSDLARTIAGFHAWLRSFAQEARAAGISQQTVDATLAQARWQPRVVELDRAQPEFTRTPWAYLDSAVSPQRVAQGREQRRLHAAALDAAEQRHGVPAGIITAIWGMESNYGGNFGSFSAVDALATLAYDGRRRDWARGELLAALRIVDRGDIAADALVGSWAGAMGHTQFMPSGFLKMAVDFGLLRGSIAKEFVSFHLPERSFLYLLHAMRAEMLSPSKLVASPDWRLFLMRPSDVEHELLRLHQYRKLEYQVAGSLVQLSLPCNTTSEYAERWLS